MRAAIGSGIATKAAISVGKMSDVQGLYPEIVREKMEHSVAGVGAGLMTINPVMGTALANAYTAGKKHRGAVLLVDAPLAQEIPEWAASTNLPPASTSIAAVDWIHSEPPELRELCSLAGIPYVENAMAATALKRYVDENKGLSEEWKANTLTATGLEASDAN